MKNFIVLSLLLLAVSISAYSQTEWAPIGAKWANEMDDWWSYRFIYETFTSVKDTLVLNKQCRKIEVYSYTNDSAANKKNSQLSYFLMFNANNKVYYVNQDTFLLLYDFSLKVGDTLVVPKIYSSGYSFVISDTVKTKYVIDTIDSVSIAGKLLKRQQLHFLQDSVNEMDGNNYIDGYIIEKIGCENYMFGFPKGWIDEYWAPHLKCYSDSEISYKFRSDANCDGFDGISEEIGQDVIKLYPNPVDEELVLDFSGYKPYNIEIINSLGIKMTARYDLSTDLYIINTQNYTKGIYYLILFNDKTRLTKKFIKL